MDGASPLENEKVSEARVLSIQSHTVHGNVGNGAAVFPLQLLGMEVDAINSVQLSNHGGYPVCKGQSLDQQGLEDLITGLRENGILYSYTHLLTGYTRSAGILEQVASVSAELSSNGNELLYVCDPVLGDNGKLYVPEELVDAYKNIAFPHATVITPNQFESEILTGRKIDSEKSAALACQDLHQMGPKIVVITGLNLVDGQISTIASEMKTKADGSTSCHAYIVSNPELDGAYSGTGDLFASQLLGALYLEGGSLPKALERACACVQGVLTTTARIINSSPEGASKELRIIQSRTKIESPKITNKARLSGSKIVGIIFDMDGTLTEPGHLDLQTLKKDLGLRSDEGILEQIEQLPLEERGPMMEKVMNFETDALCNVKPQNGLKGLFEELSRHQVQCALITRNNYKAVDYFLKNVEPICNIMHPLITRDFPYTKPDPKVAEHVLDIWKCLPEQVLFVGDSKEDILCGKHSGCKTCLVKHEENQDLVDENLADFTVSDLTELSSWIENHGVVEI